MPAAEAAPSVAAAVPAALVSQAGPAQAVAPWPVLREGADSLWPPRRGS